MEGSFGSLHARLVIGIALALLGIVLGIVGWLLLRRQGSGWRIGRLLSASPRLSLEAAVLAAQEGPQQYVSIHGRIDSDEEFPGDEDQPLVFRRRRLQRRQNGRWETFDDERLAVPFRLAERGVGIAIDGDALGDGLVVVPRLSTGVASDLTEAAASGSLPEMPGETPVQLRIDQVSAIEHATAAGVPSLDDQGNAMLSSGLERPLILTTLDPDEAMRVLASPQRGSLLVASGLLVAAPIVIVAGVIAALVFS